MTSDCPCRDDTSFSLLAPAAAFALGDAGALVLADAAVIAFAGAAAALPPVEGSKFSVEWLLLMVDL